MLFDYFDHGIDWPWIYFIGLSFLNLNSYSGVLYRTLIIGYDVRLEMRRIFLCQMLLIFYLLLLVMLGFMLIRSRLRDFSWSFRIYRIVLIPLCPLPKVELAILGYRGATFEESERTLIFYDFSEAINYSAILWCLFRLCLQSDFDNFEGLHDENLWPSWVRKGIPATIPLKKATNLS